MEPLHTNGTAVMDHCMGFSKNPYGPALPLPSTRPEKLSYQSDPALRCTAALSQEPRHRNNGGAHW